LLKYKNIRFDKVILCGSILPKTFPWQDIIDRGQVRELRNEYGVKDIWVNLVALFIKGAGSSGRDGFIQNGFKLANSRIIQERFEFKHSEYFFKGHMRTFWISFLCRPSRKPVRSPPIEKPVPVPVSLPPIGLYVICVLIIVGVAFGLGLAEIFRVSPNALLKLSSQQIDERTFEPGVKVTNLKRQPFADVPKEILSRARVVVAVGPHLPSETQQRVANRLGDAGILISGFVQFDGWQNALTSELIYYNDSDERLANAIKSDLDEQLAAPVMVVKGTSARAKEGVIDIFLDGIRLKKK
jgi:hypothetical protein